MAIFLTILKIIGIVLLCIIGLILFIILYVLLAPFWFKIQGNIDREMNYNVKIKACTFLHFLQVHVDYFKDEGLNYNVSILGTLVRILPKKEKTNEESNTTLESEEDVTVDNISDNQSNDESNHIISSDEANTENPVEEVTIQKDENISNNDNSYTDNVDFDDIQDIDIHSSEIVDTESDDFEERFNEKDKNFFIKVREFFEKFDPKKIYNNIKEKIENLKKNADKIYKIVFDEANKDWLKKVFRELKKFLKSMGLNMRGTDLDFSLGSPDTTGQVSGALALFPPIYNKKVRVIPDFNDDNLYFDGNVFIKGRIHLVCVLYFVLVIYFDSNTKKILNKIKQEEK